MKQYNIFKEEAKAETGYTSKIKAPLYEPKNKKPHPLELANLSKYNRLKNKIQASDLPSEVKKFLIVGATRHIVFNYGKIADFYAHSDKETQQMIEESALVIIDFEKAVEHGYMRLSEKVVQEYLIQKK